MLSQKYPEKGGNFEQGVVLKEISSATEGFKLQVTVRNGAMFKEVASHVQKKALNPSFYLYGGRNCAETNQNLPLNKKTTHQQLVAKGPIPFACRFGRCTTSHPTWTAAAGMTAP